MKGISSLVGLGLLAGLLAAAASWAQPGPKEKWLTTTSGPFTVYSNAKPAKTQEALLALEQLRTVISACEPTHRRRSRRSSAI